MCDLISRKTQAMVTVMEDPMADGIKKKKMN